MGLSRNGESYVSIFDRTKDLWSYCHELIGLLTNVHRFVALREPNWMLFAEIVDKFDAAALVLLGVSVQNHLEKVFGAELWNLWLGHWVNF